MKKHDFKRTGRFAFTIIELLVVIAIIALLTGLLAPAIKVFKRSADGLKQKSIFHGFETGLEIFSKDFDGYPNSAVLPNETAGANLVCGAQHLAEALFGQDQQGFDPWTRWYAPNHGTTSDPANDTMAYANTDKGSSADEIRASNNRRKECYCEVKKDIGLFTLEQLYGAETGQVYPSAPGRFAPVISDVFRAKKITLADGRKITVGNPILYYKADAGSRIFKNAALPYNKWIYNYNDNKAIIQLKPLKDPATLIHRFDPAYSDGGTDIFYDTITNPKVTTHDLPFNPKTFILISAGWDGIFGTKDDISNFDY